MEPEGSLLHLQVPVTCSYPEPDVLISVGRFQGRDYSGDLGVGWGILLKWTFSEYAMNV
jgi:hypothetical protein